MINIIELKTLLTSATDSVLVDEKVNAKDHIVKQMPEILTILEAAQNVVNAYQVPTRYGELTEELNDAVYALVNILNPD